MAAQSIDRILLGAAAGAAVASFAWFGWPAPASARPHRAVGHGARPPSVTDMPVKAGELIPRAEPWLAPAAQSRGPRWVYDLFTPPAISYDAQTGQFDVTPASNVAGANAPAAPPGVELIAVRRDPFPLQLVGYVGGDGSYLGTFENLLTAEIFLAGSGRRVPALGLEITEFTVQRRPVAIGDGAISNQPVATAIVRDERTGRRTALTAGERTYTDELRAILANDDEEDGITHEVRPGDEFQRSDSTYKIERLQLDPPAVEFSQVSSASARPFRLSLTAKATGDTPPALPEN